MRYLTRAVLNRNAGVGSLTPLLDPADPNQALDAHHRLIWALFPNKDANREFLWRSDGSGRFYILSHRKPVQTDIFLPLEIKGFDPALVQGDRLSFILRANATKTRRRQKLEDGHQSSMRVDLVMDKLYSISGQSTIHPDQQSKRSENRLQIANYVAMEWLASIGERVGFSINCFQVDNYSVRQIRRPSKHSVTLGIMDMRGVISIDRPAEFIAALTKGFGRAKAFGCGLMLIRRT